MVESWEFENISFKRPNVFEEPPKLPSGLNLEVFIESNGLINFCPIMVGLRKGGYVFLLQQSKVLFSHASVR